MFGANAAGKSNLLDGLHFMTRAVTDSYRRWDPDGGVPRRPYRLDLEGRQRPSAFVLDVLIRVERDEVCLAYLRSRQVSRIRQVELALAEAREGGDRNEVRRLERYLDALRRRAAVEEQTARTARFLHGACPEPFDLDDESDGTRSWLAMLPDVLAALDTGSTMVVDEIDSSLHPQLTAQLIRLFQSEMGNPRHAQLIFTTHDASLLGNSFDDELLSRDQIWFVEKEETGASRLYPLTDFHPRKGGENRERRYLAGSYGAIPIVSETDFLAAVEFSGHDQAQRPDSTWTSAIPSVP